MILYSLFQETLVFTGQKSKIDLGDPLMLQPECLTLMKSNVNWLCNSSRNNIIGQHEPLQACLWKNLRMAKYTTYMRTISPRAPEVKKRNGDKKKASRNWRRIKIEHICIHCQRGVLEYFFTTSRHTPFIIAIRYISGIRLKCQMIKEKSTFRFLGCSQWRHMIKMHLLLFFKRFNKRCLEYEWNQWSY